MTKLRNIAILIRGAGEMASGIACRLYRSNLRRIIMTDIHEPLAVRRAVSFCEAIPDGSQIVEGIYALRIDRVSDAPNTWEKHAIPIIPDPENAVKNQFKPDVVIDAVMAKKNTGASIGYAQFVIALGPGFMAGSDAHCVIETNRGHDLGRLFYSGSASPDTGVPGEIAGHTHDRVLRAPCAGLFLSDSKIGDLIINGQPIGSVSGKKVLTKVNGAIRGLIRSGSTVTKGLKIGDVDPRGIVEYCFSISEKSRAIGGSVLEAILSRYK